MVITNAFELCTISSMTTEPKRFGARRKPIVFYINDEEYHAVPEIPAGIMLDIAEQYAELENAPQRDKLKIIMEIFEIAFLEESFKQFETRLRDKQNGIGIHQLTEVVQWLFGECYSLRPTPPPQPSLPGLAETPTGPASTAGAPAKVSNLSSSLGTASST